VGTFSFTGFIAFVPWGCWRPVTAALNVEGCCRSEAELGPDCPRLALVFPSAFRECYSSGSVSVSPKVCL